MNLLVEPSSGYLPYARALRWISHLLLTMFSRDGCDPPPTVGQCCTSVTRAGVQSLLRRVIRELTILKYVCLKGDLTLWGWLDQMEVIALRKVPAANSPGQGRDPPLRDSVAVDNGVRVCTKVACPPPSSILRPWEGNKDPTYHYAAAEVRQDNEEKLGRQSHRNQPVRPFRRIPLTTLSPKRKYSASNGNT